MFTTTTTIVGNLTADPELRYTPNGIPLTRFGIAVNLRRQNDAGQWEDAGTDFYNVTAWRQLAINLAQSLSKGDRVIVAGRLTQRSWESDNGERRSAVEITAEAAGPDLTFTAMLGTLRQSTEQETT